MAELRGIGERALASAEHDFVVVVILIRDHEISNAILIEVRSRNVELASRPGQFKRPGSPERTIASAEKDYCGI